MAPSSLTLNLTEDQPIRTSVWHVGDEQPGLEAEVVDVGEGVPVVFLHGLVGLNEHWESVVNRVCDRMRCILFQLPLLQLRGDLRSIAAVERVTARFLADYLDEPAILAGNSFGGHVALRVALAHQHLTRGLVLAGASGLIEESMVSDIQIRPSREWLARKIGELFHNPDEHMRAADLDRAFQELSERAGARTMVRLSRSARRDHLGDQIAGIKVPTLIIWGRNDIVTPPAAAEGFARLIPNSHLLWLDNCGHVPMVECADEFAEALTRFVKGLEGEPTGP